MSTTTAPSTRNGVDTEALFTTLDAVKAQPELAKFQFRATNTWVLGTHNVSTIDGYHGAGQELVRADPVASAGDPVRRRAVDGTGRLDADEGQRDDGENRGSGGEDAGGIEEREPGLQGPVGHGGPIR